MSLTKYYFKIWVRLTVSSFQVAFIGRLGVIVFTLGKLIRFGFFLLVLWLIVTQTKTLAGYTLNQTVIFFLTFNLIDSLTQMLFREVYRFRSQVVSGDFDLTLVKPINPLFKMLFGGADPLDLVMILPIVGLLIVSMGQIHLTSIQLWFYSLLLINSLIIAASFHIFVLALGILTTEVDHTIMIYRDISSMARFPIDIYQQPLRSIITFIIPVGVMMTFPAKALLGLLSFPLIVLSTIIGGLIFFFSLKLWQYALSQYSSASS